MYNKIWDNPIRDNISYLIPCIFLQMIDDSYLNIYTLHGITFFCLLHVEGRISQNRRYGISPTLLSLYDLFSFFDVYRN